MRDNIILWYNTRQVKWEYLFELKGEPSSKAKYNI